VQPTPFSTPNAAVSLSSERALHEYARFLGRRVHVLPARESAPEIP
jgi:hypothetical protein